MEKLGLNQIRERFLKFFESRGHLRLESFPLVPQNDKTLLLINAGMAPLKPYFTGELTPPSPRVATCQKCIRTPDIENVGKTARHGTYFEMLGNFSFGDYFKKEAAQFAWEFITKELEMPIDRLWVSIYLDDDEAFDIWTRDVGVAADHIFRMGKADNFWEIGQGPCGPCSEIYYDRGEKYRCHRDDCKPGCDCDRYLEFWNLVFTQFYNDGKGNYTPLKKKNIDTGMGLERIAAIMQDVESLFDVDTIHNIMKHIMRLAQVEYGKSQTTDVSLRVITDHIRSTTFLIADGVIPSNEGRGYVLRRLLRRAIRHARLIGITQPFMREVSATVIAENKNAYPSLVEKQDYIKKVMAMEEERFNQTLESGLLKLDDFIEKMKSQNATQMSGDDAFRLYDTYGFPVDLTLEILSEGGLTVDIAGFQDAMKAQRVRAKSARADTSADAWSDASLSLKTIPQTKFTGYSSTRCKAQVLAIINGGQLVENGAEGDTVSIILDSTVFYAESGGQVADTGVIENGNVNALVTNVVKTADGKFCHTATIESGNISVGEEVALIVDAQRRVDICAAHSTVHLLHTALREQLGSHIQQAGSLVEPNRLRFDFTHFSPMTQDDLNTVEDLINHKIRSSMAVTCAEMPIVEAKALGAIALFGEKYGNEVRVVKMGDFSVELCGGTHIDNTAKIGMVKITGESSVAAGVRRIEAVTGFGVTEYIRRNDQLIADTADAMKTTSPDIARRAAQVIHELRECQHNISTLDTRLSRLLAVELLNFTRAAGTVNVVAVKVDSGNTEALRNLTDSVKDKAPNIVCVLAAILPDGKIQFAAACGEEAVKRGAHAGNILKEVAKMCGGGGGGRASSATAGGSDITKLEEALEAVNNIVEKQINLQVGK